MKIQKTISRMPNLMVCLAVLTILSSLTSISGCSSKYTNYISPTKLFSISYPSNWDLALSSLRDVSVVEQNVNDAINSNIPVESAQNMFFAAKEPGSRPAVYISVESVPVTDWTYNKVVEAYINEIQQSDIVSISFQSFSNNQTTVNGRKATIFDLEYTIGPRAPKGPDDFVTGPVPYTIHDLRLLVLVDKTVWIVDCIPPSPDDFSLWEPVFQRIARSLRVYK